MGCHWFGPSIHGPSPLAYHLGGRIRTTSRRKMTDFDQANRPPEINHSCLRVRFPLTSQLRSETGGAQLYARAAMQVVSSLDPTNCLTASTPSVSGITEEFSVMDEVHIAGPYGRVYFVTRLKPPPSFASGGFIGPFESAGKVMAS